MTWLPKKLSLYQGPCVSKFWSSLAFKEMVIKILRILSKLFKLEDSKAKILTLNPARLPLPKFKIPRWELKEEKKHDGGKAVEPAKNMTSHVTCRQNDIVQLTWFTCFPKSLDQHWASSQWYFLWIRTSIFTCKRSAIWKRRKNHHVYNGSNWCKLVHFTFLRKDSKKQTIVLETQKKCDSCNTETKSPPCCACTPMDRSGRAVAIQQVCS